MTITDYMVLIVIAVTTIIFFSMVARSMLEEFSRGKMKRKRKPEYDPYIPDSKPIRLPLDISASWHEQRIQQASDNLRDAHYELRDAITDYEQWKVDASIAWINEREQQRNDSD